MYTIFSLFLSKYKFRGVNIIVFKEWRNRRENKIAILEATSSDIDLNNIESLDIDEWEMMIVASLNFWLAKFLQEVSDKKGERYPARTLSTRLLLHLNAIWGRRCWINQMKGKPFMFLITYRISWMTLS